MKNNIMIKVYNRKDYGTFDSQPIAILVVSCFYVEKDPEKWHNVLHGTVDDGDLHFFDYPLNEEQTFEVYSLGG